MKLQRITILVNLWFIIIINFSFSRSLWIIMPVHFRLIIPIKTFTNFYQIFFSMFSSSILKSFLFTHLTSTITNLCQVISTIVWGIYVRIWSLFLIQMVLYHSNDIERMYNLVDCVLYFNLVKKFVVALYIGDGKAVSNISFRAVGAVAVWCWNANKTKNKQKEKYFFFRMILKQKFKF